MSQISLVGAGPGPLELLTLRALHRLEAAEVVVYDRLVGSEILARIPHGAARFDVGKRCGEPSPTQEEINALLRTAANGRLQGILGFEERALVSADFVNDTRSGIVDGPSTMVIDKRMVKVVVWYDNEYGYAHRMIDLVALVGASLA